MFTGFDPMDGSPLYEMIAWDPDPEGAIWIHKKGVPLWFAHLVRDTWFIRLAYTKYEENQ
jgi:hypothetical protein